MRKIFPFLVICAVAVVGLIAPETPFSPSDDPFASSYNSGDIAWMLTATALVLLMTPGLAFFYG